MVRGPVVLRLILLHIALFALGTLLCVLSFRTPLFAGMDVFFYRGLALILFWALVITAVMAFIRHRRAGLQITIRDLLLLFISFFCINVVFFTHVPVTAERSVSVFMLGYMADHSDEAFTQEEMEQYFVSRYVGDFGAFAKRFHEQEETGTIVRDGDGYRITESGKRLMKMYDILSDWYGLDDRLIHPGEAEQNEEAGDLADEQDQKNMYKTP